MLREVVSKRITSGTICERAISEAINEVLIVFVTSVLLPQNPVDHFLSFDFASMPFNQLLFNHRGHPVFDLPPLPLHLRDHLLRFEHTAMTSQSSRVERAS